MGFLAIFLLFLVIFFPRQTDKGIFDTEKITFEKDIYSSAHIFNKFQSYFFEEIYFISNLTIEEKIKYLKELLKKSPDSPYIKLELAKLLDAIGQYHSAYLQLKEIVKKHPNFEFADEIKHLIEDYEHNRK